MYIHYDWVKDYLKDAPSMEEAARLLNLTGLETELEEEGLEIEHTVNRPDAMSHFGVARELAVKLNGELVEPPVYTGEIPQLEDGWKIETEDVEQCPRYIGVKVDNVKAEETPSWLKAKLASIDQTSHNFLVDLTNFLLWEFGHPSHAFDATLLEDKHIIIRRGRAGETLTTLDGQDHEAEGLLCIADGKRPIAFAGVMGGQNTEVSESTTELLLELAVFKPGTVRRTGSKEKILSDARHRFERGVDRERMDRVIRRFLYLLLEQQPEARIMGIYDMDRAPFERASIRLRRSQLNRLLGIHLEDREIEDLMTAMDCRFDRFDGGWQVSVPGYKVDVTREADMIEEIIRFAGLDLLETDLPEMAGTDLEHDAVRENTTGIRRTLQGMGLQEAYTYSFQAEIWDKAVSPEGEPTRLRNPMNKNQAVMRRCILPGLLVSLRNNQKRGIADVQLFEVGHTFRNGIEPHHLAVALSSGKEKSSWWEVPGAHPFYQAKGIYERLASRLGWDALELRKDVPNWLTPGEALGIYYKGNCIGGFGTLSQSVNKACEDFQFETLPVVLEIDLEFVNDLSPDHGQAEELSVFPGMKIDMAFVVDDHLVYDEVNRHLLGLNLENLESLELFDVYQGKSVGTGKKSLGFRFRFQALERTLTSEEVSATMERVTQSVKETFGAVIRM
ncbi:MAG: phenylalanine--tRNA ligase subunit beta [Acidobacteriota bacterium]|nr:phenylalanine--tRNA ligase subunit beta [Acidobacteriota bacterium]